MLCKEETSSVSPPLGQEKPLHLRCPSFRSYGKSRKACSPVFLLLLEN